MYKCMYNSKQKKRDELEHEILQLAETTRFRKECILPYVPCRSKFPHRSKKRHKSRRYKASCSREALLTRVWFDFESLALFPDGSTETNARNIVVEERNLCISIIDTREMSHSAFLYTEIGKLRR
jgi:hypothetical protein